MPGDEDEAGTELRDSGVTLEFQEYHPETESIFRYSDALPLSNPKEIQRVALSLIEERASA